MVQEATELDMDVFSKHIGPYFSWLESQIETGWQQSDSIPKDVLKEVRSVATTMRARFILGVSRGDFAREVERAMEVLELAVEAFPQESEEIEAKMSQFTSGIAEKLGSDLVPSRYRAQKSSVVETPKIVVSEKPKLFVERKVEVPKIIVERKTEKVEKPVVKVSAPKPQVKPAVVKVVQKKVVVKKAVPKVEKPVQKAKPKVVAKAKVQSKPKKRSFLARAFRNFIYGN